MKIDALRNIFFKRVGKIKKVKPESIGNTVKNIKERFAVPTAEQFRAQLGILNSKKGQQVVYNKNGVKIKKIINTKNSSGDKVKYIETYDENGVTRSKCTVKNNGDKTHIDLKLFKNGETKQITVLKDSKGDINREIKHFDKEGHLTKYVNPKLGIENTFSHSKDGSYKDVYTVNGSILSYFERISLGENKFKEIRKNDDGIISTSIVEKIKGGGQRLLEEEYPKGHPAEKWIKQINKYDEDGNLIKNTKTFSNNHKIITEINPKLGTTKKTVQPDTYVYDNCGCYCEPKGYIEITKVNESPFAVPKKVLTRKDYEGKFISKTSFDEYGREVSVKYPRSSAIKKVNKIYPKRYSVGSSHYKEVVELKNGTFTTRNV